MTAIAGLNPDRSAPAYFAPWGAQVNRPTHLWIIQEKVVTDDYEIGVDKLVARAASNLPAFVALRQVCESCDLSIAIYASPVEDSSPGLDFSRETLELLGALDASLSVEAYTG